MNHAPTKNYPCQLWSPRCGGGTVCSLPCSGRGDVVAVERGAVGYRLSPGDLDSPLLRVGEEGADGPVAADTIRVAVAVGEGAVHVLHGHGGAQ